MNVRGHLFVYLLIAILFDIKDFLDCGFTSRGCKGGGGGGLLQCQTILCNLNGSGTLTEFKKNFLCIHCTCKMGALTIDFNFFLNGGMKKSYFHISNCFLTHPSRPSII